MTLPRKVRFTRRDYETELGEETLARQQAEAKLRFDCCGELKEQGHHRMCRRYVEPPEIHPDQESML